MNEIEEETILREVVKNDAKPNEAYGDYNQRWFFVGIRQSSCQKRN